MKTVAGTTTFVVLGKRPRSSAIDLLGGVSGGAEAVVLVLGLRPTPAQQALIEEALALAAERRFVLTAQTVADSTRLHDLLRDASTVRIVAAKTERRRWNLRRVGVSGPGAR